MKLTLKTGAFLVEWSGRGFALPFNAVLIFVIIIGRVRHIGERLDLESGEKGIVVDNRVA